MQTVVIPNLLARIKAEVRKELAADQSRRNECGEWRAEFARGIYVDYRKFVHKHWPAIRRGEVEAAYAHWLNDLVADQASTFVTCIQVRRAG